MRSAERQFVAGDEHGILKALELALLGDRRTQPGLELGEQISGSPRDEPQPQFQRSNECEDDERREDDGK